MKTLVTMILLIAVTAMAYADPTPREVKSLTAEYVDADTGDDRRAEILSELDNVDPMLCQRTLKRALRDDDERPQALTLATKLRVTGLWRTASRHLGGDDDSAIYALGFATRDSGSGDDLRDAWIDASTDSAEYAWLQSGFTSYAVDLDVIEDFEDDLAGDRSDDAASIVKFQLGAGVDDPAELLKIWDELIEAYEIDAREFKIEGDDVTASAQRGGDVVPIGANYRLGGDGKLTVDMSDYNEGDFEVVVRVRATGGELQRVSLMSGRRVWMAVHRNGQWSVTLGNGERRIAEYVDGEWVEISMRVEDLSAGERKMIRKSWVTVGGETLIHGGATNGPMNQFTISGHGGELTVAALEIRKSD